MKTDYSCETTRQEEFRDFQKLREFMRAFEGGNLPKSGRNHAAHVAVGMWYFSLLPAPEAAARVGEGIRAYNRAQGVRTTATHGYHETITLFWLRVTHRFLCEDRSTNLLDRVNAFLRAYRAREDMIFEHYSRELLRSWKARCSWIDPDLQPLDS